MPFEGMNFNLARPTVQVENPMDVAMKGLAMKGQVQQQQMGQMQAQQLSQQIQDAADLRTTLQSSSSLDDALIKAQKLGSPAAQGFIKNALEMKEKGVKLSADQFKLANDHIAKVGQDILGYANSPGATPQGLAGMIQNHAQQGNLPPQQANEMLNAIPTTPDRLKSWAQLEGIRLGTAPDVLKMFTPKTETKDTGSALVSVATDPLTGKATLGGTIAPKTVTPGELLSAQTTRRGQDMGVGIYGATPGLGGNPAGTRAPGAPAQPGGDPLGNIPEGIKPLVKAVGTYQMLPSQVGPRQKTAVMNLVAQAFPNYSIGDAESNQKFIKDLAAGGPASAGGIVGASERLLGHIGEAADLTDKLGDSSFGKLGNAVGQTFSTATGTGNAGDVKAFELTKGKIIAELNKLANGGVPEAKQLESDVKQISASDPPEVKYKVFQSAAQLGLEQTHALEAKRNNILGQYAPQTSLLSPRAQDVVQRIFKGAGSESPNLPAPTTQGYTTTAIANSGSPTSSQPATMIKPGTKTTYYLHPDGNYYLAPPK